MQTVLDCITRWSSYNHLLINHKKKHFMLFKGRLAAIVTRTLSKNNNIIPQQACVKLLSFIDGGMNWNTHIDKLCIKLFCCVGIIKRQPCKLPLCARRLLYFYLVYPYLQYFIIVRGSAAKTRICKIQIKSHY